MYHTHFYFWSLGGGICRVFISVWDNIYIAVIVNRLWAEQSGVQILTFSVFQNVRTGYWSRQPPIQWVLVFFLGVTCPGYKVYHSSPSKVMNLCSWTSTPSPPICLHGVDWDSVLHLLDYTFLECCTRFAVPLFHKFSLCWLPPTWFKINFDPAPVSLINLSSLLCKYICNYFF